jgi:Fur family transcriptional regulator, ferric uptake regulator
MERDMFKYHLEILCVFLQKQKLRNSIQRNELLKFICHNIGLNRHFEADEIYGMTKEKNLGISRASVFRNLMLFSDIGILRRSKFGENHFHYELNGFAKRSHHHLICKKCGDYIEFENGSLQKLADKLSNQNGFEISDYRFEVFGLCSKCKKG